MQISGPVKVKLWGQEAAISPLPGVPETGDPHGGPSVKSCHRTTVRKTKNITFLTLTLDLPER